MNWARLTAWVQRSMDLKLTGRLVLEFNKGKFMRWRREESGGPDELPMPPLITRDDPLEAGD